ncbi:MAG: hypothetical protein EA393_14240 [Bacteroidetes bacterium]|nr:MAG: hypothetical protein EA393_14240 [Bacteroidota bacterium]
MRRMMYRSMFVVLSTNKQKSLDFLIISKLPSLANQALRFAGFFYGEAEKQDLNQLKLIKLWNPNPVRVSLA